MNTENKNKVNITLSKLGQCYQILLVYISRFREVEMFFANKNFKFSLLNIGNPVTMEGGMR